MPRWLVPLVPVLVQACVGAVGLTVKPNSWKAWAPTEFSPAERVALAGAEVAVREPGEGVVVAGAKFSDVRALPAPAVWVGSGEFAQGYLDAVVQRARRLGAALAELPRFAAGAYPAHKIALGLLLDCAKPRLAFFTRVTRPGLVYAAAREFDSVLWEAAAALMGLDEGEAQRARQQASRRPVDGGLGLLPEERRCPFAYLASWLDSAEALGGERCVFAEIRSAASVVGQHIRQAYGACVSANARRLPPSLEAFLEAVGEDELESKFKRADGSVRWQAVLMRGKDEDDAEAWLCRASKATRERLAEMGGAWIFAPDVDGVLLSGAFWLIAMRLRFGLSVRPALPESARGETRCQVCNQKGGQCKAPLDDHGHHACACQKAGQRSARHRVCVRWLHDALKRRGLLVREEQWVEELSARTYEVQEDGSVEVKIKEARLDIVARDGTDLYWLDFTGFHPYVGSGPRIGQRQGKWSLLSREKGKHRHYITKAQGRRVVANGRLVPIAANSYGGVGKEAEAFLEKVRVSAKKLGRESTRLEPFLQSLVVFFTASNVLAAYGFVSE